MKQPLRYEFYRATDPRSRAVAQWISDRIPGCGRGWDACVALRVFREDTVGAVVFHDWNPEAGVMCMSAAGSDGWLSRPVLKAMHAYVFDDAGCQLAALQVSERNHRMRRIALAYGYREYVIPRLRGRDEAECLMTLSDDDWRASRFHKR